MNSVSLKLSSFRTNGGVHRHDDNHTVTVPVLMWIKALDMLMDRLRVEGLDFGQVSAISGTGQQHGTVYWKRGGRQTLQSLQSSRFLFEQLSNAFSVPESPIWMDSSTSGQ